MKSAWKVLVFFTVLLSACTRIEEDPITDWVQLADFQGRPRASSSTFVIDDKAYVCCGRINVPGDTLNEVWQFDCITKQWTQLDTFPGQPRVKAVAVTLNGKGYVGLGSNSTIYEQSVLRDFYMFDPISGLWTQKTSYPGRAASNLAYAVVDGCLYTTQGFDGITRSKETYRYDPITDSWTRLEDCPHAYSASAAFSIGKYFYVAGGYEGRNIRTVFRFHTEKNKWFEVASMPKGRMLSQGLEINGKGYVLLGRFWNGPENGGGLLADILEYDPNENTWTDKGDFPGGRRQNAAIFANQGRGYILMGENDERRLSDVWSFTP